ncbi:hypothetical protein REC12_19180 [Desulfosporosinus sp. PR]|uniref:hypothetical protein n=1 Tax=Candidatus Desulfosporosinus nitrosoreducens TaxID=3401928 RepID=UPI0027FAEC02|nr:hypothetical protein [Desulfosporosinus sp. PR]MDQ7095717.1 hypothetical protein [Desulfosporosinus sp. PR]
METHDHEVIGESCIYCGSTENVHAYCKIQHHGQEEKKMCYSVCPNCIERIEKELEPDVPCETCGICGKKTEVYAFCNYSPLDEGGSEKVCYCVCPDCVATLQDKVFDYYDEILKQGYEPVKK